MLFRSEFHGNLADAPKLRNEKAKGDLIVTLKVQIPTSLTERQKELLKDFYGDGEIKKEETKKKEGFFDKFKSK